MRKMLVSESRFAGFDRDERDGACGRRAQLRLSDRLLLLAETALVGLFMVVPDARAQDVNTSADTTVLPAITVQAPPQPKKLAQPQKRNSRNNARSAKPSAVPNQPVEQAISASGAPNVGSGSQGQPSMASQITISGEALNARPVTRPGEILEAVPGLVVTQHSGEGKANQYFLRGYNLDHGTDLAIYVDDVPINLRTHGLFGSELAARRTSSVRDEAPAYFHT